MNGIEIGLTTLRALIKLVPPPKPPTIDYSEMRSLHNEYFDKMIEKIESRTGEKSQFIDVTPAMLEKAEEVKLLPERTTETGAPVATSCIACSASHVATVAGALGEAMRFAREGGITDPEVIRRLDAADQEITIMERIDLSPESVRNSPAKDQEMAHFFLPKIRELRQNIGSISNVDELERAASEASILSHEFRLKRMESNGTNLNPIIELAKKVQSGEMTMEEARSQVKQYLPQGG